MKVECFNLKPKISSFWELIGTKRMFSSWSNKLDNEGNVRFYQHFADTGKLDTYVWLHHSINCPLRISAIIIEYSNDCPFLQKCYYI